MFIAVRTGLEPATPGVTGFVGAEGVEPPTLCL